MAIHVIEFIQSFPDNFHSCIRIEAHNSQIFVFPEVVLRTLNACLKECRIRECLTHTRQSRVVMLL